VKRRARERFVRAPRGLVDRARACAILGVKPQTLYTYVSRGLVRVVGNGRASLYDEDDLSRLATRSAAHKGHVGAAASALRWGEPVLDSAISDVHGGQLAYRGQRLDALVRRGARFEDVIALLWEAPFTPRGVVGIAGRGPRVERLVRALPDLAQRDRARADTSRSAELERGARLVRALAARVVGARARGRTIAEAVARGLGTRDVDAIDLALIASADHELNQSTFVARVAASVGADLYACVGAALYVFLGPRHGTSNDALESFVATLPTRGMEKAVRVRLERGVHVPGFGHPLYPLGDPRGALLVSAARAIATRDQRVGRTLQLVDAMRALRGAEPALDAGLVALAEALALPPGSATALFALGRSAGWIAHVLEQRAQGVLLRPRARYVGPRF
jgi:citrate synthase